MTDDHHEASDTTDVDSTGLRLLERRPTTGNRASSARRETSSLPAVAADSTGITASVMRIAPRRVPIVDAKPVDDLVLVVDWVLDHYPLPVEVAGRIRDDVERIGREVKELERENEDLEMRVLDLEKELGV
jgi:hypothetical protein